MLIALCGSGRQSGKDTAAGFIEQWCQQRDLSFQRLAFGDTMKLLCALALDHGAAQERDWATAIEVMDTFKISGCIWWSLRYPEPDLTQMEGIQGRDFIINLAEGAKQLFGADFWVLQVLPAGWAPDVDVTVITDLRFPEEANRVAECKGVVMKLQRDSAEQGKSENVLSDLYIDGVLDNNSTPQQLQAQVERMMALLIAQQMGG